MGSRLAEPYAGAAVGVCGFGRCGSTMVMRMLDVGGIPPVEGSAPGSYELPSLMPQDLAGRAFAGHTVKLLDYVLHDDLPAADWRFIWIDRDSREQARSAVKFMNAVAGLRLDRDAERDLAKSYSKDRPRAIRKLGALAGRVDIIGYEDVLRHPEWHAKKLAAFLAPDFALDAAAAAAAVHQRTGACRPDLAFEMSTLR